MIVAKFLQYGEITNLEDLQQHPQQTIYNKVAHIIETYLDFDL